MSIAGIDGPRGPHAFPAQRCRGGPPRQQPAGLGSFEEEGHELIQQERHLAGRRSPTRRLRRSVLAVGAAAAVILGGLGAAAVSAPSARADVQGPCDIYAAGGTPCVAAHSTTRALYAAYDGPLYQVRRASDSTTLNITPVAPGGVADSAAQDTFCAGTTCVITEIYDQSPNGNNLTQAPGGGAVHTQDNLANATQAPVLVDGQKVYGVYIAAGDGYRDDTTTGIATGDNPEGEYAIFDGSHYNGGCCFDYGNAETSNNDTGAGHMEAIYFGNIKVWGYGSGNGPWVMADLENGLFSGQNARLNAGDPSITFPFVTAMVKGGANQWAIRTGDSTTGALTTDYSGPRPAGYNPMHKEGAIILGIGGDNSNGSAGTFYEGVMTSGYPTDATEDAVQANIVAAGYKAIPIPLASGPRVSIQATTSGYTNYYLKHDEGDDGVGIAPDTSLTTEAAKEDATFVETAPLASAKTGCVSFESVNKPGYYLRHQNFVLHLQAYDGSTLNAADGTFCPVAANSGQAGAVSFQSDNFPTKYLRHYNLVAYIASNGGTNAWDATASWAADTSWLVDAPLTATTTTLTWSPATPNGNDGYYTSAPSFSLDAEPADFATGIQYRIDGGAWTTYTGPVTIDQQGTHTVDYYSTSNVANNEQAQSATVNVDTVPPTATFSGSIGNVYFGSVPDAPTCTAADDTSGPAGCVVTGYDTSVGTHTLTATATDNAGNVGTAQETYTVLPWTFQGFYSPVQMGTVNTAKGGIIVPLKFQLFSNTTELTDPSLITMSGEHVDCTTQAPIAPIQLASPGNTGLRYDPVAGQFIDNWKTPATPGACYTVTATSADGSSITAQYQLS
jgi:non-reducing end alpha-L-arabinofuranosidase